MVKSPAMVRSAPLNVAAVVGLDPDLRTNSPLLFVMEPNVVPASFNNTSAPSASMMISPGASNVTFVAPFDIMSKVVVPSSLIVTLASSASKTISPAPSKVILPDDVPNVTAASPVVILSAATLATDPK